MFCHLRQPLSFFSVSNISARASVRPVAKQGELYRIETPVFTSSGFSSGFDLALEILRRDHGSAVAFQAAQELVV